MKAGRVGEDLGCSILFVLKTNMKTTTIEHLLHQTADLLQSQRTHRETTGEGFNFFTALGSYHDENRHSRFLHSLLNPRGAHGQGALFLRRFLVELGLVGEAQAPAWRWDQWRVETEVTFRDSGRRIDLLLHGPEAIVGIENKVLAEEGPAQLRSYAQSLATLCGTRPATLVFLTPSGRAPESSPNVPEVRVVCCRYGRPESPSLFGWLEACHDALAGKPRLVEVVNQYAEVVDRIGGNTMKKEELDPVVKLLQNRQSFEAATVLMEALSEAKVQAQVTFWRDSAVLLPTWPQENMAAPGLALVRRYYDARRDRSVLGRVYDTGLCWSDYPLVLALELLPDKNRPYLTWKFQLRSVAEPGKVVHLPGEEALSKSLCALAPNLIRSSASLATGDLLLPDGTPLDITDFKRGRAPELLDPATRAQVLQDVAQAVADLVQRAGDALATPRSRSTPSSPAADRSPARTPPAPAPAGRSA